MLLTDTSFVVVDVETTGLSAANHRITEIAMVRLAPPPNERGSWEVAESFQTLLNPEQYIPPFITRHTGITNAMVYGKPKFSDIVPEIENFLAKSDSPVLVGHNVKFDHGFLVESFDRVGQRFQPAHDLLCTCRLARRLLPQLRSKSLASVQAHLGIRNSRQHRALGDAEATAKILAHFIERAQEMEIETLEDFLRLQFAKPNYARRKTKRELSLREKVRLFPDRPGVYTMLHADGTALYVGKAKNLHERVASYFAHSHTDGTKLTQLMRIAKDIVYEETGSELSALLLESRKIKELHPRFNSMERRYKPQSFLRLDVQNDFPELSFIREPAPDGAEYFGPFKSRDAAEALMEILDRAFKLRKCGEKFRIGKDVKPCLYYDMHRCDAPCALLQTKEDYRGEVRRLQEFLAAGDEGILAHAERLMREAADRLDFEEAEFFKRRFFELRRILGNGERESASLSSNDFIILNPLNVGPASACHDVEVLFVRFGRLVKQAIVDSSHLPTMQSWFERQLRQFYGPTPAIPPTAGKPEIDEMRILSKWVEESRKKGSRIIYIERDWELSTEKLVHSLREILKTTTGQTIAKGVPA
jgi:DNA polymerase-3 subunit epsilon